MAVNSWWSSEDRKESREKYRSRPLEKRGFQKRPASWQHNEYDHHGAGADPNQPWVWADSKGKWTWDHAGHTGSHIYKQKGFHIDKPPPHKGLYNYQKVGTKAWKRHQKSVKRIAVEKWRGGRTGFKIRAQKKIPLRSEMPKRKAYGGGFRAKNSRRRVVARRRRYPYNNRRMGGFIGRFQGMQKQELKYLDLDFNDALISTGGTIIMTSLLGIAAGTGPSERLGRRIFVKSIDFRGNLYIAPDSSVGHDEVRVLIYQDAQCNGAVAATTDILDFAGNHDWMSYRNLEHLRRFKLLCDKKISLNCQAGGYDGTDIHWGAKTVNFKKHLKLNMTVDYESTTGAITELSSNNIGVMGVSAQNQTTFNGKIRVRYYG